MLKLTTSRMISLFCILIGLSFLLYSCAGCDEAIEKDRQKKQAQKQEQLEKQKETEFMEGDKVVVRVFTPTGEKTYEGILIKWWTQGVTIKKDRKTLVAICASSYEIERQ